MIEFNTKDIIKIIPLDEPLRASILKDYDSYDEGKKYEISSFCWDVFTELTEKLAQIKYDRLMEDVETGKRQLSPDMMQEAYKAVHQDYQDILSGKQKEVEQIEDLRNKIQNYLQSKQ